VRLSTIVTRDMLRRKRRVFHAAIGVAIGIMTVVTTLTVAHAGEQHLHMELERYGPNLSVVPATGMLDLELGGLSMGSVTVGDNYIDEAVLPQIQEMADTAIREELGITETDPIAIVAPRLYVPSTVGGRNVTVAGVLPPKERTIRSWWQVEDGRYLEGSDEVLVGAVAAASLDLASGAQIDVFGHGYTVAGVLKESGSNDDYLLFVPLSTLQETSGKTGIVSTVDVRALCTACPVEMIADSLSSNVPGIHAVAVRQVAEAEMGVQERTRGLMLALAIVTLLVGLFGVANAMANMVMERRRDIGIMRAVGASRRQVVTMFLYESVVLGLLGGVVGYAAGLVLAVVLGPLALDGMPVAPAFQYVPLSLALAVAISMIATLHPALTAAGMRVADAVRTSQ